jgi:hypothetical protein
MSVYTHKVYENVGCNTHSDYIFERHPVFHVQASFRQHQPIIWYSQSLPIVQL